LALSPGRGRERRTGREREIQETGLTPHHLTSTVSETSSPLPLSDPSVGSPITILLAHSCEGTRSDKERREKSERGWGDGERKTEGEKRATPRRIATR